MNASTRIRRALCVVAFATGLIASSLISTQSAAAASGNQGYAVYRDGVAGGLFWHAALMDDPHYNTTTR